MLLEKYVLSYVCIELITDICDFRGAIPREHHRPEAIDTDCFSVPASRFAELGGTTMRRTPESTQMQDCRFRSIFGACATVCVRIWSLFKR